MVTFFLYFVHSTHSAAGKATDSDSYYDELELDFLKAFGIGGEKEREGRGDEGEGIPLTEMGRGGGSSGSGGKSVTFSHDLIRGENRDIQGSSLNMIKKKCKIVFRQIGWNFAGR